MRGILKASHESFAYSSALCLVLVGSEARAPPHCEPSCLFGCFHQFSKIGFLRKDDRATLSLSLTSGMSV